MKHTPSEEEKRAILDAVFTPLHRESPVAGSATGSAAPIYKTLQAASEAHGKCPRPITQNRSHWWHNDWAEIGRRERKRDMDAPDSWPCICKTCSLRVNVDPDAHDLPEV